MLAIGAGCGNAPGRPVTVTVMGFGLQSGAQLRQDALNDFTRDTGIAVELIPALGDSAEQLAQTKRLLRQHATTPDVYLIDVIWPGTLAEHLLDLKPYLDQDAYRHQPTLFTNDKVAGRVVALPLYLNVGMLFYRTDLLKKYGYAAPPQTWEQLEAMAGRIQSGERRAGNAQFWGYVWQGGAYEGLTCNALEWQASYGGGDLIDSEGTVAVNNPNAARAFNMAAGWIGRISPPSVLAYTEADSLATFRSGNAAFLRYWNGGFSSLRGSDSRVRDVFGQCLLPAGPNGRAQMMGGFHLAVSRYSAHPRESAQLVRYLTGSAVQRRRAVHSGYLPTIVDLYRKPEIMKSLPYAEVLESAGEAAWIVRPSTIAGPKYGDLSRAYFETVHDILSHKVQVDKALSTLQNRLVVIMGSAVEARKR